MSWNMHVGAGDLGALVAALRRGDVTGAPADDVVLLLQEAVRRGSDVPAEVPAAARIASRIAVKGNPEAPDIRDASRALDLNVVYVPSMRNGTGREDRGNAIVSPLPLSGVDAIELPFVHQRHVAIAATLAGTPVRVATVHFDTAVRFGSGGPAAWRATQARTLAEEMNRGSTGPVVVAGDFNTWWGRDEPAVRILQQIWPDTADRVGGPTWRGPIGSEARLDHVFAAGWSRRIDVRRARDRFGSDHYPLYVVVTVPLRAASSWHAALAAHANRFEPVERPAVVEQNPFNDGVALESGYCVVKQLDS